ncbi:MAG: GGDEF domain-containing protein, partial [Fervidobacterium sp.]
LGELINILSDELSKEEISVYSLGERIKDLLTRYGLADTFGIAFLQPNGYLYYPYMKYIDDDRSGMSLEPEVKNLTRYVIDKRIKLHIRDSLEETDLPNGYTILKLHGGLFTIYCVPIVYRSITRGAVLFEKQGKDQFSDSTIILFDKIVDIINLSLYFIDILKEVEEDRKKLFELSIKDYLTGAYSRRFLEQYLEKEMYKSKRMGTPLSVICYIDRYRQIQGS